MCFRIVDGLILYSFLKSGSLKVIFHKCCELVWSRQAQNQKFENSFLSLFQFVCQRGYN